MNELPISAAGRRYAAFFSPPKPTDSGFPFRLMSVKRKGAFPKRGFLTGSIGPIKDQVKTGMCTGEGSGSLGERLYRRWKKDPVIFAPEFTYYLERQLEGTLSDGDCGAQVESSLIVPNPAAGGKGWCPVDVPGYRPLDITTPPSAAQLKAAKKYPGGARHSIGNNIDNMKACILSDYSFVIGVAVYDSFEADETAASGLIPYPNLGRENQLGGHEMHSGLGFDDTIHCPNSPNPGAVLTQNSWGTEWGTKPPVKNLGTTRGFCWIPYDYLLNYDLASDIRMGHLGKSW